ncbi:MAG: DUF72 domain-containing protein [Acidobacteriota bacterium]|nr:DUF72 domain-containing protein [Acidobacteriota bacterium]
MKSDKKLDTKSKKESKIQNLKSKIHVGCQGWNYADWVTKAGDETIFYPRGTRPNEMLALYAEIFDTVEVDSTFYAIPPSSTIENWYKKTPQNFTFSLKMPQEITHEHLLRETSFPIVTEFCERILLLKEKLAVVLIQLPPHFEANKENAAALKNFLAWLPQDIRFAVEFRHRDWLIDWTYQELEKNNVALCLVEGSWIPREMTFEAIEKLRSDFAYIRFMGERDLVKFDKVYRQGDTNLQIWKGEIERIQARNIYAYFSNFYEGHAPSSVNKLKNSFGQKTVDVKSLENQGSLF